MPPRAPLADAVLPVLMRPERPRLPEVLRELSDAIWTPSALRRALDPNDPGGASLRAEIAEWLDAQEPSAFWERVVARGLVPHDLLASRGFVWVCDTAEAASGNAMHCARWWDDAPDPGLAVALAADHERIAALDAQMRATCWPLLAAWGDRVDPARRRTALTPVSAAGARRSAGVGCRQRFNVRPDQLMPWPGAARALGRRAWIEHRLWAAQTLRPRMLAEHHADVSAALADYLLAWDLAPIFAASVAAGEVPPGPDPTAAYRAVMEAGYWFIDAWGDCVFLAVPDPVPWSMEHWGPG